MEEWNVDRKDPFLWFDNTTFLYILLHKAIIVTNDWPSANSKPWNQPCIGQRKTLIWSEGVSERAEPYYA
jgi:hypothetical protein